MDRLTTLRSTIAANGQTTQDSPRRAHKTLFAIAMSVTALALSLLSAAPASAYTPSATGYPGSASTPFIYGASTGFDAGAVTFPYRTVTESPRYAAYDQWVCVTMNLVDSSGSKYWILDNTITRCAWIRAAATSVTINGVVFSDLLGLNMMIYSGNIVVTWKLANNTVIGTRTYDYNQAGDYQCQTAHCVIGNTAWGGGAFLEFNF